VGAGTVSISDATGRVLLRSAEKTVDVSRLPSGYYMLEYNSGAAKGTAPFIKE